MVRVAVPQPRFEGAFCVESNCCGVVKNTLAKTARPDCLAQEAPIGRPAWQFLQGCHVVGCILVAEASCTMRMRRELLALAKCIPDQCTGYIRYIGTLKGPGRQWSTDPLPTMSSPVARGHSLLSQLLFDEHTPPAGMERFVFRHPAPPFILTSGCQCR